MNTLIAIQTPRKMKPASGTDMAMVLDAPTKIAARVFGTLVRWQRRAQQRHHLMQLDQRLFDDMGLSRDNIATEANKFFWEN